MLLLVLVLLLRMKMERQPLSAMTTTSCLTCASGLLWRLKAMPAAATML
jgi:hypothetical protein